MKSIILRAALLAATVPLAGCMYPGFGYGGVSVGVTIARTFPAEN